MAKLHNFLASVLFRCMVTTEQGVSVDNLLQQYHKSREFKNCKENALQLGNNWELLEIIFVKYSLIDW